MSLALHLLVIIILQCNPACAMQTVVLDGDSTVLYCNGPVFNWLYYRLGDDTTHMNIFMDNTITNEYNTSGFRIDINQNSKNLILKNVTTDLAGRYVCKGIDINYKVWKINETQLVVLEKLPECHVNATEFIGPNDCNIHVPLDDILLSCNVGYRGNEAPELEWRQHGEPTGVIGSKCTQEERNTLTRCNTTLKSDAALNESHFICQSTKRAADEQYSCTAKVTVLYSFSSEESTRTRIYRGDKVSCVANSSSQSCSYKWVWYQYERIGNDISRTIESTDSVLIAKKTGLHRCEAQCDLGNHACLVYPKFVDVIQSEESLGHESGLQKRLEQENCQWTPAVKGLIIMGVLPYFAFVCYFLFKRIRRKKTSDGNHDKTNETVSETQE